MASFDEATAKVELGVCGASLELPTFGFTFGLPSSAALQALIDAAQRAASGLPPLPTLAFKLQCDPRKPVDIAAGVPNGGGRKSNIGPDPTTRNDT